MRIENREWHHSHNVSDTLYRCYGCGKEAGDEALYEPCPTPDRVGQSSNYFHGCPCKRQGRGCINYRVNKHNRPHYRCHFTGLAAYVPTDTGN